MEVFQQVATVRSEGGITSTLLWDGKDAVILEGEFAGMKSTVEKTVKEAWADVKRWSEDPAIRYLDANAELLVMLEEKAGE